MRIGPVAFLFLVTGGWVLARAVALWPESERLPARQIAWAPEPKLNLRPRSSPIPLISSEVEKQPAKVVIASRLETKRTEDGVTVPLLRIAMAATPNKTPEPSKTVALAPSPSSLKPSPGRFSISAWGLLRSDASPGLAGAGQLGGSQVGLRARYRLLEGVHIAARLSAPVGSRRGKEAALALDFAPLRSVPITFTIERRLALDKGGRDAFGAGAFGGFDRQVAPRTRIDGYAQAGVVGLRSRDAYVDGAMRMEGELSYLRGIRVGVGAGLWGGAQPGASRLDVGPQLVAHVPLNLVSVRIGAEWRQRIAGDARPGAGPVLSLGADF